MKELLTAILAIALVSNVLGQTLKYSEEEAIALKVHQLPDELLKVKDGSPVLAVSGPVGIKSSDTELYHLDGRSKPLEYGVPYKHTYSKGYWSINEKNYRLMLTKDRETRSLYQRIVEYADDGKPLSLIHEAKIEYKGYKDFPTTQFQMSEDSSYITVVRYVDDNKKKKDLLLDVEIYDREMNQVGKASWKAPGTNGQQMFHMLTYSISNDGTVYAVVKKYKDKYKESTKVNKTQVSNYGLSIFQFSKTGDLVEHKLDNEGKFSNTCMLDFYTDGTPILISNITSSSYEDASTVGYHFYIWNEGTMTYETKTHNWSESEIEDFGEWKGQKVDGLRKWFDLQETKAHNDKMTFLAVNNWTAWRRSANTKYQVTISGSLFTMTIDKKGDKVDHLFVPRQLESGSILPPLMHIVGDRPVLLYNEDRKTFTKPFDEFKKRVMKSKKYGFTGSTILAYAFKSASGQVQLVELPESKNDILYSNMQFEISEDVLGVIILELGNLIKKNKVKVATLDFSEFK